MSDYNQLLLQVNKTFESNSKLYDAFSRSAFFNTFKTSAFFRTEPSIANQLENIIDKYSLLISRFLDLLEDSVHEQNLMHEIKHSVLMLLWSQAYLDSLKLNREYDVPTIWDSILDYETSLVDQLQATKAESKLRRNEYTLLPRLDQEEFEKKYKETVK